MSKWVNAGVWAFLREKDDGLQQVRLEAIWRKVPQDFCGLVDLRRKSPLGFLINSSTSKGNSLAREPDKERKERQSQDPALITRNNVQAVASQATNSA